MKKHQSKALSLICALICAMSLVFGVVACDEGNTSKKPEELPTGDITYTVTVKRSGGYALSKVNVVAYDSENRLVGFGETDKNGVTSFKAKPGTYTLRFGGALPEGYKTDGDYTVTAEENEKTFNLGASLISTAATADKRYEIGDVMNDFSYVDTEGNSGSLSKVLETKKAVLINFWYINCPNCVNEFPDMAEAYADYSDKMEIIAINPIDNSQNSEAFRTNANGSYAWDELPFTTVANDNACAAAVNNNFAVTGYPTSVIIDREGVICFIGLGGGTKEEFTDLFKEYTAEPYTQHIYFPDAELDRPDVPNPPSADIEAAIDNTQSGFNAKYTFDEDEYSWPWVVGKDGASITPSNTGHNNSYSIIYAEVKATSDQVIAFDYKTSTEEDCDYFFVFVDGVLMNTYSGVMDEYKTCYAYVPEKESGTYVVSFAYSKDARAYKGDDTVHVKNLRFIKKSDIAERTEIVYRCASGSITDDVYSDYITPVFNETDGYYHVNDANGPLLLADLMNPTAWSNETAWSYVVTGKLEYDSDGDGKKEDYTDAFTDFAQISNNSRKHGMVAVTKKLKVCLEALVKQFGKNPHANEWLEICSYYRVYGVTDAEEIEDPARGLSDYNAYDAVLSASNDNPTYNHVNKETIIMPRGLWYKFVPQETGIYNIHSVGDVDTIAWLCDETKAFIDENDDDPNLAGQDGNFTISHYLEKGKTYYILVDFNDVNVMDEFDFVIVKLAQSGKVWTNAASGEYTAVLDDKGNITDVIIKNAVEYILDENDIYHVKNSDGSIGPMLYINLTGFTNLFTSHSVKQMVDMHYYYCKNCGAPYFASVAEFERTETPACWVCGASGKTAFEKKKMFELPTALRQPGGAMYGMTYQLSDETSHVVPMYALNNSSFDPNDGESYHQTMLRYGIKFDDYTDVIKKYIADSEVEANFPSDPEEVGVKVTPHSGFAPATKELADIIQKLIVFGDYAFSPTMDNAWLMLANYFYTLH